MTKAADHTVLIAVLAVSAAVVAAVIAAATATVNQRRQLKHDRQMQDLAELRSVLDEAAIALEDAVFALTDVIAGFTRIAAEAIAAEAEAGEEIRDMLERRRTGTNREAMEACAAARDRMMRARQRIAIRLGRGDLSAGYGAGVAIVIDIIRELYAKRREQDAGGVPLDEDFADRINDLSRVRATFILHAVDRVGSQV